MDYLEISIFNIPTLTISFDSFGRRYNNFSLSEFFWFLYPTIFIHLFIRTLAIYTLQQVNLFKLLDDSLEIIVNDINHVIELRTNCRSDVDNMWLMQFNKKHDKFYTRLNVDNQYIDKLIEIHDKLRLETLTFQQMNSLPVSCAMITGSIGIITKVCGLY